MRLKGQPAVSPLVLLTKQAEGPNNDNALN